MSPIRHAFELLHLCMRPRRRLLLITTAAVVLFNILELLAPKVLELYVDSVAGNPLRLWSLPLDRVIDHRGRFILLPAALLVLAGARWIATYFRSVYQTRLGQGALFDLRSRIFNTMQNLSFAYHDTAHSGTLISNVVEDVNYANMFLQRGLMLLLESLAFIVISYLYMASVCPKAAAVSFLLLASAFGVIILMARYGYGVFARTKVRFAETVQAFSETMEGYLVVKGFGTEARQEAAYNRHVDAQHAAALKEHIFSSTLSQCLHWISVAGIPAVLAIAILEARTGRWDLTVGKLFVLFYLQSGIRMRTWGISRAVDQTIRFAVTAERIGRLLHADDYLEDAGTAPIPAHGDGLVAESVSFSYGDRGHSVNEVSLHIREGETIGLVGRTGAGKSTLALLLCRFYDPTGGRILLHGADIRDFPVQDLRNEFSLVFQDTFLFSASIRDNIAYGSPDACFEDIIHAASTACIHDFIMSLPQKYDTDVGERGVTLSGGQRQRISIARAILRKPRFLILDACTSALDSATEKAIQDGLQKLRATTTCIVIAHRFSSIEHADRVAVMEDGRLVEIGTPAELNRPGTRFRSVLQP
jgi:ATP-binding cassette subfamily B protein